MTTATSAIRSWARELPYWEQVALDRLSRSECLTDALVREAVQYFFEDNALAPKTLPRPPLGFFAPTTPPTCAPDKPVILRALEQTCDLNALAPAQRITFSPNLTVLFGANGSGKSGYARFLATIGFCRGDTTVLPDVTRPPSTPPRADLILSDGTTETRISITDTTAATTLRSLHVFDHQSVLTHVADENELSFTPLGLDLLTRFASVVDDIRQQTLDRISEYQKPHTFLASFTGESDVTAAIKALGPTTETARLRALATLTDPDKAALALVEQELDTLRKRDVPAQLTRIRQDTADIKRLRERLVTIQDALSPEDIARLHQERTTVAELQDQTTALGLDSFRHEQLHHTGSAPWRQMSENARTLATNESTPDHQYPVEGDPCLLCHQPLTPAGARHLQKLWAYLQSAAERSLQDATTTLQATENRLRELDLSFFTETAAQYRAMHTRDPATRTAVTTYLDLARALRDGLLTPDISPGVPPTPPLDQMDALLTRLWAEQLELTTSNPTERINTLEGDQRRYQHRQLLCRLLPTIETHLQGLRWAARAETALPSTTHVTRKQTELFNALVTDEYVKRFTTDLQRLGRTFIVQPTTRGHKGRTFHSLGLQTPATHPGVTPAKVLSEGEKRAVALADFLTEVSLDPHATGIVLDDPVTSLDVQWKQHIAARLVEEAKERQVIIFTHDLHFLYTLKNLGEGVPAEFHWIKRGDEDDRPGYVFLQNSPATEKDYYSADIARRLHAKAKSQPPENQQWTLMQGFGALRTSYEALVLHDIFGDVVRRWDERLSIERLTNVVLDRSIIETIVAKSAFLSRYIDAHLHSDEHNPEKPTPAALLAEIEAFEKLKKDCKRSRTAAQAITTAAPPQPPDAPPARPR